MPANRSAHRSFIQLRSVVDKVSKARQQQIINQNIRNSLHNQPHYVIAELTTKGFGLGIWYGAIFSTIHVLITAARTGMLPHVFTSETGLVFLIGLGGLTVFGLGCGVAAACWNMLFSDTQTLVLTDKSSHHEDKNVPRRVFNLAVVTLQFVPKLVHYLKSNAHLSFGDGDVTFTQEELEQLHKVLSGFSGSPGIASQQNDPGVGLLSEPSARRGYQSTGMYKPASTDDFVAMEEGRANVDDDESCEHQGCTWGRM